MHELTDIPATPVPVPVVPAGPKVPAAPSRPAPPVVRIASLAMWMQSRRDRFTFDEIRDELPALYRGDASSIDRMWTRDKQLLAALGMPPVCEGRWYELPEDVYAPRVRWGGDELGWFAVVASCAGHQDPLLARALLKTLASDPAAGSTAEALAIARTLAPAIRFDARRPVVRSVGGAYLLLCVLPGAGEDGLTSADAAALTGIAPRELAAVARELETVDIPGLAAPFDTTGVVLDEDRIFSYLPCRGVRPLQLTAEESEALRAACANLSALAA